MRCFSLCFVVSVAAITAAATSSAVALVAPAAPVHIAVIGGQVAPMGAYPYAVQIQTKDKGKWYTFCSGSLIAERHILTAGHCVSAPFIEGFPLRALFANQPGTPSINIVRRAAYGSFSLSALPAGIDLGIMELAAAAAPLSSAPVSSDVAADIDVRQMGYGLYQPKIIKVSDELRLADLKLTSNYKQCEGFNESKFISSLELCALPGETGAIGCSGDSGGALINSFGAVIGVASWSKLQNCDAATSKRSMVFAKVAAGQEWLRTQTGAPLFGLPAVPANTSLPAGAKVVFRKLSGWRLQVRVLAEGRFRAKVYVFADSQIAKSTLAESADLILSSKRRSAIWKIPASLRGKKARKVEVLGGGRIWNELNNGITVDSNTVAWRIR